eukprot:CCRYP_010650-RA/>CCRYP_010650-RA protein AED:0.52 eAED:0.46 QI:0/0/0/1/1/1/2/0/657
MLLDKLRDSVSDAIPSRPRRNTSENSDAHFHFHTCGSNSAETDESSPHCPQRYSHPSKSTTATLQADLGANASVPYSSLHPTAVRPLEFPAPTVDRAVTASAHVRDHRTGNVFYATSVLLRRAVHAKNCPNAAVVRAVDRPAIGGSLHQAGGGREHRRNNSRDSVHSWHSGSLGAGPSHGGHNNNHNHGGSDHATRQPPTDAPPCGPTCDLPLKAYCVRRKLCDTVYGSVRLCVVLRRIRRVENGGGSGKRASVGGLDERSVVDEAVWETTDQMVAIKVVKWSKLQQLRGRHLEDPIKELAAMQLLGNYHPHVITLSDSLQDETHLFSVYPYLSGGDLYGRLWEDMRRSPTGRIDQDQARAWFRQILSALTHFQKKGVCHRDLCMENMMLDEWDNLRIIDFGLCLRVPYADPNNRNLVTDVSGNTVRRLIKAQGQGGKWEYMAPEVAMRHECFDGFAIDLWAVGIVLFEFLVGKKPFAMPDAVDKNFYTIAIEGDLEGLLRIKGISIDEEALDLLQKMLRFDPSKRLTLAEVVSHPWVMRGYNESKPKKVLSPVEETNNRWFIQNNAINENDPDEYELAHRLRIYSCSSNDVGDDVTADSTDEESRNPRGYSSKTNSSEFTQSFPYNLSFPKSCTTARGMRHGWRQAVCKMIRHPQF